MLAHLRLKHDLRWRGKYPPIARPLFALFVLGLLLLLTGSLDYYYAKAAELEALSETRGLRLSTCPHREKAPRLESHRRTAVAVQIKRKNTPKEMK